MVFAPYPLDLPECQSANNWGLLYGIFKGGWLILLGSAISSANPEKYTLAILGTVSLSTAIFAGIASSYDWKAEHAIAKWKAETTEPSEQATRAQWLSLWTSYCFAAAIYGRTTKELAAQDLKIMAIKLNKIALGISFGFLWGSVLSGMGGLKGASSALVYMCSASACFILYYHDVLPKISEKAKELLQESVETYHQERRPLRMTVLSAPKQARVSPG